MKLLQTVRKWAVLLASLAASASLVSCETDADYDDLDDDGYELDEDDDFWDDDDEDDEEGFADLYGDD